MTCYVYIKQLYILFNRIPVAIVHQTLIPAGPLGAAATWMTWICFQFGKPTVSCCQAGANTTISFTPVGNFDQNKWRAILLASQRYRSQAVLRCVL